MQHLDIDIATIVDGAFNTYLHTDIFDNNV